MAWLRGVVTAVWLFGCGVDVEIPPDDPPLPRFSFSTDVIAGITGEPTTVLVNLTLADGTPATNYELIPNASCAPQYCELSSRNVGPGQEEVTVLSTVDGYFELVPYVRVFNLDGHVTRNFTAPGIWLSIASNEPEFTPMLNRGMTMVVGEQRAVTLGTYNRYHHSGVPLMFEMLDTSIASVTADGVVTALQSGQTKVRIRAGSSYRDVTVQVSTGTVAAPADNVVHVIDEDGVYTSQPQPTHWRPSSKLQNHTLVVDSRGYPHVSFRVGDQIGVASWTGTGFGFELVPDRIEGASTAVLVIDDLDRLHLVAFTRIGSYIVYDKPATAAPSAWRRRKLDSRWPMADRIDQSITDYIGGINEEPEIAILGRPGGGAYVAYRVAMNQQTFSGYGCVTVVRLAVITDGEIETHDVEETWVENLDACPLLSPNTALLALVPRASGLPTVISTDGSELPAHTYDGTRWVAGALDASRDYGIAMADTDVEIPLVAPPVPGHPDPVVAKRTTMSPISSFDSFVFLQGNSDTFMGNAPVSGLLSVRFDTTRPHTPANAFVLPETLNIVEQWRTFGAVSSGDRIHFLADHEVTGNSIPQQLVYMQRRLPSPHTRTTDPETTGKRIDDVAATNLLQAPPIFLTSGTRMFLERNYDSRAPRLLVSTSVASGWQAIDNPFIGARNLWAAGNEIYAFSTTHVLLRSQDSGQTATVLSTGANGVWLDESVLPSGLAASLVVPDATGTPTLRIAAGSAVVGQSSVTFTSVASEPTPLLRDELFHKLLPAPVGIYHVGVENGVSATPDRLFLRQYAADGSVLLERYVTIPALGGNDELIAKSAAVTAAGTIVVLSRSPSQSFSAHAIVPATGGVLSTSLGVYEGRPAPLVNLADGRIALVGTTSTRVLDPVNGRPLIFHVSVRTSTDGLTWSTPTEVRPLGGDVQYAFSVGAPPSGGLLMGLNDNSLMGAAAAGTFVAPPYALPWTPPTSPAGNILQVVVP